MTGSTFQWHIVYPGPDGKLETEDDLYTRCYPRVPVGIDVSIMFTSMDYVYPLLFPQIDRREVAVPEITWDVNFGTQDAAPRDHVFKGDQMCGYSHTNLIGVLTVLTSEDFEAWPGSLSTRTAKPY